MIAKGFKPVGWVAAVAGAALSCYMLSLNVAAERAELAKVERQIIAAKQDIRSLQTELGTRGRLTQLEHWNAEVLALSAPSSDQFLQSAFMLASFSQPQQSIDDRVARVRMASADTTGQPSVTPAIARDFGGEADDFAQPAKPLIRQASFVVADRGALAETPSIAPPKVVPKAATKAETAEPRLIDDSLIATIGAAAKAEKKAGGAGGQ